MNECQNCSGIDCFDDFVRKSINYAAVAAPQVFACGIECKLPLCMKTSCRAYDASVEMHH